MKPMGPIPPGFTSDAEGRLLIGEIYLPYKFAG